jgi:ATP synthase protein I
MAADQAEESKQGREPERDLFRNEVGSKEARKLQARREQNHDVWFWLGMFGMVGWSVAIPTVLGVVLGRWIDATWPSRVSWTLMLLFIGLGLGCLNAWYWVTRESGRG